MSEWQPIETAPDGVVVMTKIDDGAGCRNEQLLKRQGRLWWFTDGSMYVYYTPTHWKLTNAPYGLYTREERQAHPARLTDSESGKADGSAKENP